MDDQIKAGNFRHPNVENYADFTNSMAHAIEQELNDLLLLDDLPPLPTNPADKEVRDRRRLFVAIARGVVRHLVEHKDAIDIRRLDNSIVHPVIHVEGPL